MSLLDQRQVGLALEDLAGGLRNWRTWFVMGNAEVRQRYRRSLLGPFWVSLSMGVQATVMGFLLAFLFKIDVQRFLPFLCISLVCWTFLTTAINEGANAFIANGPVILQVKRPLSTYVLLALWRNAIIFAHTVVVFFVAALAFGVYPGATYLLVPLGLAVFGLNVGWMAFAAGLISARFRDVPLLIQNAFNPLVWLTPVFYHPDQLGPGVRRLINLNPLTYVLEVGRAPFLNEIPPASTWVIALTLAVAGWGLTFILFVRTRSRVAFWL